MDSLTAVHWIALLALAALPLVFWLGRRVDKTLSRLAALERQLDDLNEMLRRRRHTYPTQAGLEDAEAVNLDLVRHINELQVELDAMRARATQQMDILRLTLQSPHTYDPERPAGARPTRRPSRSG